MDVVTGFEESELKGFDIEHKNGYVYWRPLGPIETNFLINEWWFLNMLKDTPYVPKPIKWTDDEMIVSDVGKSEKITIPSKFVAHCARFIRILKERGIRHGDLTGKNIIVKDNVPVVVDWKQSKIASDPTMDKRPEGDAYHLLATIAELLCL